MIIEFSPSFAAFGTAEWAPYLHAVENLLTAHASGWHSVCPGRAVCNSLLSTGNLSRTQNAVISRALERAGTLGGQAVSAKKVILCFPDHEELSVLRANQIPIRLAVFNSLDHCSPSRLITENAAADGAYLEALCNLMSREIGHNHPLKLVHVHGGGSTLGGQYATACSEARPTLCVVDSDKQYANSSRGSTARSAAAHLGNERYPTTELFELPVRELENTIPISALYDVYSSDPNVRIKVEKLCEYIRFFRDSQMHEDCNVLNFLDLKNGIRRAQIATIPPSQRNPFIVFAQTVSPNASGQDEFDDENDTREIHPGISANMLQLTLEYITNYSHDRREFARRLRSSPNWPWLRELLRLIAAYGVGGDRIATAA